MLSAEFFLLGFRQESVIGTAEVTPTDEDALYNAMDIRWTPNVEYTVRPGQAGFGRLAGKTHKKLAQIAFSLEHYAGTASAPAPSWAQYLLPACRWVNLSGQIYRRSVLPVGAVASDYRPRTLTMWRWKDGVCEQIHGAMGNFTIDWVSAEIMRWQFEFTGIYDGQTDTDIPGDWEPPAISPCVFGDVTFTTLLGGSGGITPALNRFRFSPQNRIVPRAVAGSTAGYSYCRVSEDDMQIQMDQESILAATYDLYGSTGKWLANTELAMVMRVGSVAGSKVTISAAGPNGVSPTGSGYIQIRNREEADLNKVWMDNFTFDCNGNGPLITFS
jgi:hypothetical protein